MGDALDRVFGLLDLLALAAVVIAALGIVNTLSMDTWERVRELGMLRAVGMSRRQVWRSVLVEAGILGAIGAVVGSVAGDRRRRAAGRDRGRAPGRRDPDPVARRSCSPSCSASRSRCWPPPSRRGSPGARSIVSAVRGE